MTRPKARAAFAGVIAAILVVHGVAGWWSPLAGDDWRQLRWAATHRGGWLAAHAAFAEAIGFALARWPWLHAVASPVVSVALLAGVVALAARRLPDPRRWSDVLGVALASAVIWIALPRAGAMWFHRPYAAAQIWGAAVVVWLAVPYRLRWRLAGAAPAVAMFALGAVAGTTTRQLAVAAIAGLAIAIARTPRPDRRAWMWLGLAGAVAGTAASIARAPWADAGRVARLEPTLVALAPLLRAGGQVVVLVGLLVLAVMARRAIRAARDGAADADDADAAHAAWLAEAPSAGDALAWLAGWIGLGVASQLGPRASEATLVPAVLALGVAALPYLGWLARAGFARWIVVGVVVVVHAVAWTGAVAAYAGLADERDARMAAIAGTPAGEIARVATYAQILPSYWAIGEDWTDAAGREAVARELWGLADLELVPGFRQLERNPDVALALEVDRATPAQVAAAAPPVRWARDLAAARRQLAAVVARLRAAVGPEVAARLRVTNVDTAGTPIAGRPIYAAWADDAPGGALFAPVVGRSAPDATSHVAFSVPAAVAARLPEVWAVSPRGAERVTCIAGRCVVALLRAERTVILACNGERCLAADAVIPHF